METFLCWDDDDGGWDWDTDEKYGTPIQAEDIRSAVQEFVEHFGWTGNVSAKIVWVKRGDKKFKVRVDVDYSPTFFVRTPEEVS